MLFLLRPPTKWCYWDIMMHALNFLSRERAKTHRWECPTCDWNRREGKGEMEHQSNGRANLCLFCAQTNGQSFVFNLFISVCWYIFIIGLMLHFPFSFPSFSVTGRTLSSVSFTSIPWQKIKSMHCDVTVASFCRGSKLKMHQHTTKTVKKNFFRFFF